jgi:hypothetical protein
MQRSAISQLSRRFEETIKGDQELRKVLNSMEKEGLLNDAACPSILFGEIPDTLRCEPCLLYPCSKGRRIFGSQFVIVF